MHGWAALGMGQRVAVFATLAATAVLLGVSMVGQMVPGSKYALAPGALPVGILTVLLILIAATFRPQADPGFVENRLKCVKNGSPIRSRKRCSSGCWFGAVPYFSPS
jgi:hypothetical protein